MTGLALVVLLAGGAVAVAGVLAGVAVAVARGRRRRNRVVPEVATNAPESWAGTHTPLARLHRRLIAAVAAARAVPDPDGSLIAARVDLEQTALAVDDHLVALHGLAERERAGRMAGASAAVAAVEEAAAKLADAGTHGRAGVLRAVEDALERAALVAEARAELDALDVTLPTPEAAPPQSEAAPPPPPVAESAPPDEDPRQQPSTG